MIRLDRDGKLRLRVSCLLDVEADRRKCGSSIRRRAGRTVCEVLLSSESLGATPSIALLGVSQGLGVRQRGEQAGVAASRSKAPLIAREALRSWPVPDSEGVSGSALRGVPSGVPGSKTCSFVPKSTPTHGFREPNDKQNAADNGNASDKRNGTEVAPCRQFLPIDATGSGRQGFASPETGPVASSSAAGFCSWTSGHQTCRSSPKSFARKSFHSGLGL